MANVFLQFLSDAEHGDLAAVKRNIENGIDLETRDEVRNLLMRFKLFVFLINQDQQTALILAARCDHYECVKVLLEAHADVNAEDVVSQNNKL